MNILKGFKGQKTKLEETFIMYMIKEKTKNRKWGAKRKTMNIQTNIMFKSALIKMAEDKKKLNSQLERKPIGSCFRPVHTGV